MAVRPGVLLLDLQIDQQRFETVPSALPAGEPGEVRVDIRGREIPLRVVEFPFVREGAIQPGI